MLRDRFFSALTRLASSGSRRLAYAVVLILTTGSILLIPRLGIQTTRQGMVRDDLPVQAHFNSFMEDFGSPTQLVLVLEGETAAIKAAADEVAARLVAEQQWVRNVFHRIDLEAFRRAGLYYADQAQLEQARDFLAADPARTRALLTGRDLSALLDAAETASAQASAEVLDGPMLEVVTRALDACIHSLEGDPEASPGLADAIKTLAAEHSGSTVDPDGYLLSTDHRMAFLFIQQAKTTDEATFIVPFMKTVRQTVATTLEDFPGVEAGFTGWPAAIEEDYLLLLTDLPKISLIASLLILVIFLAAFRSVYRTILVFLPLLCGVVWTLGLTVLTVGHLNYLSSVFVGVLFGLGIDFGIYFIRRFDEERLRGADAQTAVHRTLATAGQGIVTGGLTAVVAFLAIALTDQPAFAELGLVAGMGVMSVLVATLLLLPALLVQFPPNTRGVNRAAASPALRGMAQVLLRRPGILLTVAAITAGLCILSLPRLGFDYDLNNLLPEDSETLRVLRAMEQRSPYTDQFVAVIADDLDQVRRLQQTLLGAETVNRVESIAQLIPDHGESKALLLGELGELLPATEAATHTTNPAAVASALENFMIRLEEAEEDAFAAGNAAAVSAVGDMLDRLSTISTLLAQEGAGELLAAFEARLFDERQLIVDELRSMTSAEALTVDDLDPSLRERFVGASGRMLVMAFPSQPIWDRDFLDRFVNEVRQRSSEVLGEHDIDSRVTGFAVTFSVTAPAIRRGFTQATWAAVLVVCVMLLVDLRSLKKALVAALPLAATALGLLGGMAFFGVELNMATQVAFPILFGLGVAYGVHMSHRMAETSTEEEADAVGTTGKAILLAAATTMAGFGSMMLAEHSALVSFGLVLFLGIFISALAALLLAPALHAVLRRR